ncbi:hypothetical protein [Nostoc commune]|uniref:hypothetical protein n=1 Tax=Nostoc commune TaxID=1178 RepID=UPI0011B1F240|nr:hypothetical protein [Nostoc commune]
MFNLTIIAIAWVGCLVLGAWCDRKIYSNTVRIRFFDDTPLIAKRRRDKLPSLQRTDYCKDGDLSRLLP